MTAAPNSSFESELRDRIGENRRADRHRELRCIESAQGPRVRIDGAEYLNFSSNDYLGLASHPAVKEAALRAIEKFGTGSGASRLICGSLAPHHELETALAELKKTEAALAFSSGYAAALGAVGALVGKDDIVVLDKLVHASLVDAARLSGAKLRVFAHNDLNELEDILRWAAQRSPRLPNSPAPRTLVITESVFSMDGDTAPLREMVELKDRFGAWLMTDEAHATGLFGASGAGLAESLGLSERIEVQMGTLGKALGSGGGFICGSRALVEYLVNRARPFIFSTAPVPAAAAAATAAVRLVQSPEGIELRRTLRQHIDSLIAATGLNPSASPILPLIIGSEVDAVAASRALRERDIYVPAIRPPTVPQGTARLRVTMSAAHAPADVEALATALRDLGICRPPKTNAAS